MVVEKCFVLYFPFKANRICTVHTTKIVCLVLAVLYGIFNAQFFFIIKLRTLPNGTYECVSSEAFLRYIQILWNYIISSLYSFIPFAIMILGNRAILCRVMLVKWKSRNASSENTSQALNKTALSGLFMLLAISLAFLIFTGPIAIVYNVYKKIPPTVFAITHALEYLNHSINSVLYCISGSRFRKELISTLSCGNYTGNSNTNSTSMTNMRSMGSIEQQTEHENLQ